MPSGQDYTRRLQEEARKTLEPQLLSLEERFNLMQDQLLSSIDQVREKVAALRNGDITFGGDIVAEAAAEAVRLGLQERGKEMAFLSRFSTDMRRKETQEEILTHLLDGAQRYAPRAILFVIRGNEVIGWSSRGLDEDSARKLIGWTVQVERSPLLKEALSSDGPISGRDVSNEWDLLRMLSEDSAPWHAFPMHAVRRRVAVLLAAGSEARDCDLDSLSLLMDITGLRIENIALKILQEMKGSAAAATQTVSEAAPNPEPVETPDYSETGDEAAGPEDAAPPVANEGAQTPAAEESESVKPAAPAEVEEHKTEAMEAEAAEAEQLEAIENGGQHSAGTDEEGVAESFEEETADEQAPVSAPPYGEEEPERTTVEAAAGSSDYTEADSHPDLPTAGEEETSEAAVVESAPVRIPGLQDFQPADEEEKLHSEAKRFARLLVSEIKLYNEQRLADGRQNRDIYVRLQRDIDRSREMYQKRVSPDVVRKVDYFHDEVIRILADNDPTTLGSEYPGPSVEG